MSPALDRILPPLVIAATALMLLAASAGGCAKKPKPRTLPDLSQRLAAIGATTAAVADELPKIADRIDQHAKAVGTKTHGQIDVGPELIGLATETAGIRGAASRLAEVPGQVKESQAAAAQYTDAITAANARVAKLEDEKKNGLRKLGQGQIGLGGFLLVIGVIGFFTGTKWGKLLGAAVAIGGGTFIVLGLVVGFYSAYIVLPVIAIAVGSLGYYAWRFVVERKATKELVQTVEKVKQVLPDDKRQQMFGNGAMDGIVDTAQSPTTKAEVRAVRQDPTVRKAPEISTSLVNEPNTVPSPAVSVSTADAPVVPAVVVPPVVVPVEIQPGDASRG